MKNFLKIILVLSGFTIALLASSNTVEAQKKKKKHGEACVGNGTCGKTKAGKILQGQYRVW